LRIVDLESKPPGLTNGVVADSSTLKDLASKGFIAEAATQGGPVEIYSSNGEIVATMKNGTEYVLRFGDSTRRDPASAAAEPAGAAQDPTAAEKKNDGKNAHRYVYVTARFNEGAVDPAQFEKLPDLPAKTGEPAKENEKSGGAATTDKGKSEPADGADAEKEKEKTAVEPADAANAEPPDSSAEKARAEASDASAEKAKDEAKTGEAKDADASKAEEPKKAEATPAADKTVNDAELEKVTKERERITKGNAAKLARLRQNVEDLKRRFNSSFFVVDESTFEKIHLGRDKVIKKKEPPKPEGEAAAEGAPAAQPAPGGVIPGLPTIPGAKQ
jgi:hypothetical protein